MVGCWAIWEWRNKVVFDGVEVEPERVVRRVEDVLCDLAEVEREGCVRSEGGRARDVESGNDGWKAASVGFMKLNVNAGLKEGEGVGTGVVCRNDKGEVLWGASIVREQCWDPEMAEAVAVIDGLLEVRDRGIQDVEVESDCLRVIEALKERRQGRSMLAMVFDDIHLICNSFRYVVWLYTSRINNSVAHALAHVLPRVSGKTLWSDVLPPSTNTAALFDLSLLS
ncbi:uncharacterized protein LOC141587549 [Silene latifolia]|uniref:uncharacterized protein LOC141587549 n=1 Tax=Silene latifolia TaxID=37657 RepID=UPI003D76F941